MFGVTTGTRDPGPYFSVGPGTRALLFCETREPRSPGAFICDVLIKKVLIESINVNTQLGIVNVPCELLIPTLNNGLLNIHLWCSYKKVLIENIYITIQIQHSLFTSW